MKKKNSNVILDVRKAKGKPIDLPGKVRKAISDKMEQRGVSQCALARKIGIDQSTISRLINSEDKTGKANLSLVSEILDVLYDDSQWKEVKRYELRPRDEDSGK